MYCMPDHIRSYFLILTEKMFFLLVVVVSVAVSKVCVFCGSQYGTAILSYLSNRLQCSLALCLAFITVNLLITCCTWITVH